MHALMRARPFAALVSRGSLGLYASHLPTVLKDEGPYGLIECHLARANPHWKDLAAGTEAQTIFQRDPRVTLRQIGMRPRLCMERWCRLGIMLLCMPVAVLE